MGLQLPDGATIMVGVVEHTFTRWHGPAAPHSYGNKPLVEHHGGGVFAEIAFAGLPRDQGWDAVWASPYGGLRYFAQQPLKDRSNTSPVPHRVAELLDRIAALNGSGRRPSMAGTFDVVAWRDAEIHFYELKRLGRDRIRGTQLRWLWAALRVGVPLERLDIVEWCFASS